MVYVDRSGERAIVVAQHFNGGLRGLLCEDERPTVLCNAPDASSLTSAMQEALSRSSIRRWVNLREVKPSDWPAYRASQVSSMRRFEADFIRLSIRGANEVNHVYVIEGWPQINADLTVCTSALLHELGSSCLKVWRACRDRRL